MGRGRCLLPVLCAMALCLVTVAGCVTPTPREPSLPPSETAAPAPTELSTDQPAGPTETATTSPSASHSPTAQPIPSWTSPPAPTATQAPGAPATITVTSAPTLQPELTQTPMPTLQPEPTQTPMPTPSWTQVETPSLAPTLTPSPSSSPSPSVVATAKAALPREDPFGIALAGEQTSHPDLVSGLNARWARTSVLWAGMEPHNTTPDNYEWKVADTTFKAMESMGLTPIVLVFGNPSWASSTSCGPIDLVGMEEFSEFAGALAERYDGDGDYDGDDKADGPPMPNVTHWEFYNEPDCHDEEVGEWLGGCWGRYGAEYAQMLAVAWQAMHETNDQTVILFGSMAAEPLAQVFNFDMGGGDFLDDVLDYIELHPGHYFDYMNFHNYYAFEVRWRRYGRGIMGKAEYLRRRLESHGQDKPLVCTEIGLRSDKEYDGMPYGPEGQSRYLVRSLARGAAGGIKAITWYKMRDDAVSDDARGRWGLLDTQYAKNPSYDAYQTLTRELVGARSTGELSLGKNVEAYGFEMPDGVIKTVLWSVDERPRVVGFEGSLLRVVDKYGVAMEISDGSSQDADGAQNGKVSVSVGGSPLYAIAIEN